MGYPFDVFGLPDQTSLADLKRAYRARALQYHPDLGNQQEPEATDIMAQFNLAYELAEELLKDPELMAQWRSGGSEAPSKINSTMGFSIYTSPDIGILLNRIRNVFTHTTDNPISNALEGLQWRITYKKNLDEGNPAIIRKYEIQLNGQVVDIFDSQTVDRMPPGDKWAISQLRELVRLSENLVWASVEVGGKRSQGIHESTDLGKLDAHNIALGDFTLSQKYRLCREYLEKRHGIKQGGLEKIRHTTIPIMEGDDFNRSIRLYQEEIRGWGGRPESAPLAQNMVDARPLYFNEIPDEVYTTYLEGNPRIVWGNPEASGPRIVWGRLS